MSFGGVAFTHLIESFARDWMNIGNERGVLRSAKEIDADEEDAEQGVKESHWIS
jgi:hypothetical protein